MNMTKQIKIQKYLSTGYVKDCDDGCWKKCDAD